MADINKFAANAVKKPVADDIDKSAADAVKIPEGVVITPTTRENMLDKILENTYTMDVLKKRVKALRQAVNVELFHLKVDPKHQDNQYDPWVNSLGKDFFKMFTRDDFQKVFEDLDKKIGEIRPLVVYLAFDPGPSQISLIGGWLRQNLGQNFIFEIKLDYTLLGGCAFVWKGVYKDYSIKAKLNQNREKLLDSFKTFMKEGRS